MLMVKSRLALCLGLAAAALVALWARGKPIAKMPDAAGDGADYSCGIPERTSLFHAAPMQEDARHGQHVTFANGHTKRANVTIEIVIEKRYGAHSGLGRIIRPISQMLPASLVGKAFTIGNTCYSVPDPGARGLIWATITNEDSDAPLIFLQ